MPIVAERCCCSYICSLLWHKIHKRFHWREQSWCYQDISTVNSDFDYQDEFQVCSIDIQSQQNETSETIYIFVLINYVYDSRSDKNLSDKLVALSADNAATNFGDQDRGQIVHSSLDSLPLCFESIVMHIHNHFATFTVRTEELKSISSDFEV